MTLLILTALWCFFLRNTFDAGRSFALDMDNEFFVGTVLSAISASLSHGEWPLRMDTVLGGVPLYNFPQLSPLYPFYFASLPIFRTPGDVVHSMHWLTVGHLLILEINTFVFLRVVGVSRIAAVAGAALFAFSANSLTYAAWLNITAPYAWFPLYLAGLIGIFRAPDRVIFPVVALVAVVLLALASPAQPLIHAVMVSIVFVVAHCWRGNGFVDGWKETRRPLAVLGAVGVLAFLIVAPIVIPTALEFKDMIRWIGSFPPVIGNARIPFAAFQVDQLSVSSLAGILFRQEGAAVGSPYVGVIGVALAAVAAVSSMRSWIARALLFIALYSIISATGSNLGLAHFNYLVPVLNKIREPSRFLVLFQFAIAALAALGIDQLRRVLRADRDLAVRNPRREIAALWVVAVLGLVLMLMPAIQAKTISTLSPWVSVLALVSLIALTMLCMRKPSNSAGMFVGLLWAAVALVLLAADVRWVPAPISASKYNRDGGHELDQVFDRLVALDPKRRYRVVFDGTIDKQMAAMLASYKGIRTLNAYFNPAPYRQFEELYYHAQRSPNYFQALGARYLVCDSCAADAVRGYELLDRTAGFSIYEAKHALPHSQLMTTVDGTYSGLNDFAAKLAGADLSKGLLFVSPGDADIAGTASQDGCTSEETRRSAERMRVTSTCPAKAALVVNEFFDPSWKAKIDGKAARIVRVNSSQMAIPLPPGQHVVDLRYRPVTFLVSVPIGIAGAGLAVLALILRRRGRARSKASVLGQGV
ncbi:YfhO family protein [Variovorax sp. J22G21]|uniref:YfhO family protein n=1 Tax=Variovorax fucosicus TaxID=3053517 RepID=UPI002578721C|nr:MULTISPECIES: YfhO family protein [unclassified Variovorax]MDM0038526.1 YfhO family protein [Variovorax sp. J22R193]MDM0063302.1 YfhO family protein [Variovorax sp. J22G21]